MKLQKITLLLVVVLVGFTSCNSDDDDGLNLLPQEEQNQVDDAAIEKFLQEHYFNAVGKLVKFTDDTSDDNETPLLEIAEEDPSGYWIVKKPGFEATGRSINNVERDSILLQYDLSSFVGKKLEDSIYYTSPRNISTTINTTGYPIWDPGFYYKDISNLEDSRRSYYEMEGIQEGLKHFNSSDKEMTDLPAVDFQGLIIVPSRLAFERDYNVFGIQNDETVYLNFQLYKVIDRQ